MPLLRDNRPEVVRLTVATIDALRPPIELVEEPLLELVQHPNPQIREDVLRVLKTLGGDIERLQRTTSHDPTR